VKGSVSFFREIGGPWWVFYPLLAVLLYYLCIEAVLEIRQAHEGKRYNVAWSSSYGDVALIGFVLLMAYEIRNGATNGLLESTWYHAIVLLVCIGSAPILLAIAGESQTGDKYHNAFVVPLLGYLVISLTPAWWEMPLWLKLFAAALILIWAGLGVNDIVSGRIDQQRWLVEHQQ
jgi:hypothetical protein